MGLFCNSREKNSRDKYLGIKTFTYFIPAPPSRSTGYREKQFDKLVFELIQKGHDILSIHTQALNTKQSSGMWVIFELGAKTQQAKELDLNFDYSNGLNTEHTNNEIEIETI